ncbi:MAG: noncanonical pyrimidine nucleotidase, YjjG family [Clostridiales bacterium]|nr:noncanonical pyrimidine nucleotidase, YjjG family [Clostridiales bacterium]
MRALLLDLDDTLLDFHAAERYALSETLKEFGIPPKEEYITAYSKLNHEMWQKMEAGGITKDELRATRFPIFLERTGLRADGQSMAKGYESRLTDAAFTVEGAIPTLEILKKDYALYALSNGTSAVQRNRIKKSGLEPYFQGIFLSEELGYAKPAKQFFSAVFREISFAPNQTVMVGDSLSADIAGANNYGIRSVWLNRFGRENNTGVRVDVELRRICDLPVVLPYLF